MSDKFLPPQNLDAERSLIGALLIDKDAISEVADILTPDDFYSNVNGIIYDSILTLYEKRQPTDIVNLTNILEEKKTA